VNNKKILVSAIISTYNSEKFIRGKIEDLLAQTIVDELEIIIVNSGSEQNEDVIIKEYLGNYDNIKYIKTEKRETVYRAWNRGIKISSGIFITNANTDDRLKHDAYEILSNYLVEHPDVGLVYADQYLSTCDNQLFEDAISNKIINFPDYNRLYLMDKCIIGSQPMWRSSIHFTNQIWFSENFEVCGDHDFAIKVSNVGRIYHIQKPLGTFFKSLSNLNKEYENKERNRLEVRSIYKNSINTYLKSLNKADLLLIHKRFSLHLKTPIILYTLLIRLERAIVKNYYPILFFHSIEFVYYLNIEILRKLNKLVRAKKLCRKFLRFKKSTLIEEVNNFLNQ